MFNKIKILIAISLSSLLFACSRTNNKPLLINFNKDSSKIEITQINEVGLNQLKNNLAIDRSYQKLVSVLQTPAEDDSTTMELEWDGTLSLNGNKLLFTPKKSFQKGKTYSVASIINTQFASGKDIVKSEVGHHVKSEQTILKR